MVQWDHTARDTHAKPLGPTMHVLTHFALWRITETICQAQNKLTTWMPVAPTCVHPCKFMNRVFVQTRSVVQVETAVFAKADDCTRRACSGA